MTMDEKMIICPKAKECGEECFYPIHKAPHKLMILCGNCRREKHGTAIR